MTKEEAEKRLKWLNSNINLEYSEKEKQTLIKMALDDSIPVNEFSPLVYSYLFSISLFKQLPLLDDSFLSEKEIEDILTPFNPPISKEDEQPKDLDPKVNNHILSEGLKELGVTTQLNTSEIIKQHLEGICNNYNVSKEYLIGVLSEKTTIKSVTDEYETDILKHALLHNLKDINTEINEEQVDAIEWFLGLETDDEATYAFIYIISYNSTITIISKNETCIELQYGNYSIGIPIEVYNKLDILYKLKYNTSLVSFYNNTWIR